MRTALAIAIAAILIGLGSVSADQADSRTKSVIPQLPNQPKLIIRAEDLFPLTPPYRLWIVTLVPAQTNGEVIRLSVPVGELIAKSVRAISDAHHRREERKIDERIARELQALNSKR